MSKYNNANWDHYKLAGHERPGDAVLHQDAPRRFSPSEPNAAPEDAAPEDAAREDVAPRHTDDEGYTA